MQWAWSTAPEGVNKSDGTGSSDQAEQEALIRAEQEIASYSSYII